MSKLGPVVEVAAILVILFLGLWFISPMMSFGWLVAVGLFSVWVVLMLEHWASGKTRDDENLLPPDNQDEADSEGDVVEKLREIPENDGP